MPKDALKPDVLSQMCPSHTLMSHVTSRWGVFVLLVLRHETLRFSALRRKLPGVSERMLSQTLKTLESDGFVHRKAFDVVPPHVEYSLTDHGHGVAEHVGALALWLESNLPALLEKRNAP